MVEEFMVEEFMVEEFMVEKFMVGKFMVEKFMVEKSGIKTLVEKSGDEMSCNPYQVFYLMVIKLKIS